MTGGVNYTGNDSGGTLTVSGTVEGSVGGWYLMSGNAENGSVTTENVSISRTAIFSAVTRMTGTLRGMKPRLPARGSLAAPAGTTAPARSSAATPIGETLIKIR